jgi:hypothetical protein
MVTLLIKVGDDIFISLSKARRLSGFSDYIQRPAKVQQLTLLDCYNFTATIRLPVYVARQQSQSLKITDVLCGVLK